jgi:hypothetical protein
MPVVSDLHMTLKKMEIIKIRVEFSKLENIQPNEAINIKILIF